MERIERLVVHVEEALRLASHSGDISRQRLALILLDSAAELLLHRESSYILMWDNYPRRTLQELRARVERGVTLTAEQRSFRDELERHVISEGRRRKIEREFDAKVDLLVERESKLSADLGRALKRLHKYRNETYHRDDLRPATLESAVRLYAYLVCELLRDLSPHMVGYSGSGDVPPNLRPYLGTTLDFGMEVQRHIADEFLRQLADGHRNLHHALAEHLLSRLREIEEQLAYGADYINDVARQREPLEPSDVLTMLQVKDERIAVFGSRDELRQQKVPVTLSLLSSWAAEAEALVDEADDVRAFAQYATLEESMEPIEAVVQQMVQGIEEQIQLAIDEARGK